jgi:hypothetical protein
MTQRYATLRLPLTDSRLRTELGFTRPQWQSLRTAAADASMELLPYIRLMLLCAAGHGGVIEHAERAVAASWNAEVER